MIWTHSYCLWWHDVPGGGCGQIFADDGFGNLIPSNWNVLAYFQGADEVI